MCDRLGIFVSGRLVCVGNPKEIIARHGGYLILSLAASEDQSLEIEQFVKNKIS